jgi:hypothetical protein
MHTIALEAGMFDAEIDGRSATIEEVFPAWEGHDRFGIVIHEPLGAVGASLLIQMAITMFYKHRQATKPGAPPVYPEIYAFHIGRAHGDLSEYDFWPPEKEVVVAADPVAIVDAINARAITRLAVPYGVVRRPKLPFSEYGSAINRLRTAWMYSDEPVADGDLVVRGACEAADINSFAVLALSRFVDAILASGGPVVETLRQDDGFRELVAGDADSAELAATLVEARSRQLASMVTLHDVPITTALANPDADTKRWLTRVAARKDEAPWPVRERMARAHLARLRDSSIEQRFQRVSVEDALGRLIP